MSATTQRRLNRIVVALSVALIVASGGLFFGQQTESDAAGAQVGGAPAKAADQVSSKDFLYAAESITVAVGAKITFTNQDGAPHTRADVNADAPSADPHAADRRSSSRRAVAGLI